MMNLQSAPVSVPSASAGPTGLLTFLVKVAAVIRLHGWVSRGEARNSGGTATADIVLEGRPILVTTEDMATAFAAHMWAKSLTDAELSTERSDYLYGLRDLARSGEMPRTAKDTGLAASIVSAHARALAKGPATASTSTAPTSGGYVGTPGTKGTFTLTVAFVASYGTQYGTTYLYNFKTPTGDVVVWKASSEQDLTVGTTYQVTGSVKEHSEYRGTRQTLINRCKYVAR